MVNKEKIKILKRKYKKFKSLENQFKNLNMTYDEIRDILDKLGEPYISKNDDGMGLGIFIAKNLIENMGGNIQFYNSKDDKAIVEIKLDNSILIE